ncbi:MAG: MBL fold metallo-hydrolase [Sphingobacteriales bacterium]
MYLTKRIFFLLMLLVNALALQAKLTPGIFVITKITPHVYMAHPSLVKRINSTSTIIVGRNYLTVVESQPDMFMAKALIKEIREKISKLPVKYLVFSHFHIDHILGAAVFLQENPSLIIISSQQAAEHISLHGTDDQKNWAGIIKQKSTEAKLSAASAKTTEKKNYLLKAADELEAYYRDISSSVIVPPNFTFSDSLNLNDSDLRIQLKFMGAAHTQSDIVVLIQPDKVLVTGDIVHDFEPLLWDANPDSWIEVLEKIKRIDFDYFVGGHGGMHKGKNIIYAWQDYMKELKAKTIAAIKEGLTLEKFQDSITIESFSSLKNGYGKRIQKFRTTYIDYLTGSLLDAVKDEMGYMWKFYYPALHSHQ